MTKNYYFDYNATTPVAESVLQAMLPYFREHYGNPSSLHSRGRGAAKAVREARKSVAAIIGAQDEKEVIFTGCGTESNNTAIRSALAAYPEKRQVITSAVEHSSIRKLARQLQKEGYEIREIGVSAQGFLNIDELRRYLSADTAVVSLMLANNETGVLFPIEEIGRFVKERGALFHVDAVQAAGKHRLNVSQSSIDYMSLSAHKLYGPKGVGALYVREGVPFQPIFCGGAQERGRRAGTENVAGVVGFGEACKLALSDLNEEILRLKSLRRLFEESLCEGLGGAVVNGDLTRRIPTTSNLRFPGMDGEALMMALDQRGICASSGSACLSGSSEPSHVLKAMGLTDEEANASLRFSFGRFKTEEDIRGAVEIIRETLQYFRELDSKSILNSDGAAI